MAAAEEKTESAAGTSGGGSGGKLVMILTLVNVLATAGVAGALLVSFQKEQGKAKVGDIEPHDEEPGEAGGHGGGDGHGGTKGAAVQAIAGKAKKPTAFGKMVTLEQFTVNLSTPGSANPKFVRVNISLEVPNEDAETEVTQKMPQVRNAVIDLFNSKRPADLATPEGRDYLKEEIRNALNGFMVTGKVKGVFFTNFALTG